MPDVLLSLNYLPDILWFRNYLGHEEVWIEKEENFVKSTARNRCRLAGANGPQMLTIPLLGGRDHHRRYADTQIAYQTNWHDSHWYTIKSAYGSAPYFEFYAPAFQKLYENPGHLLFDFNLELLQAVLRVLKIKKGFKLTTEYQKAPAGIIDLRTHQNTLPEVGTLPRYYQVFEERHGFISNLSVLDLIFNMGPGSGGYLRV